MAEKDAPQLETWAGQDFNTLELEIDKEIDSLFVPTIRNADENAVAGACPGQDSRPQESGRSEPPGPGVNLDAIQIEIDNEIDKLFVPSPSPASSPVSSASPESADPKQKSEPPRTPGPTVNLDAIRNRIDKEIDKLFVPSPPPASLPLSSISSESIDTGAGLSELIEQFNAAYLSLDWDFSRENLKKFIDALERLEPMASRSSDAKSLFRIMEVILKRLLDRPHAVNTKLVQLIRDSQGLLAHMLLIDGESGPHEKRRLKELVEKFQELRQKALAAKAAGAPATATDLNRHDEKTPLRAEKEDTAQAVISAPEPREKTVASLRPVRHADACLLVSDGKLLALPASCVVKTARSTYRTDRRVSKRGYATLSDFKPLFRGAKSGVLGEWANLEVKELGSYRFEPLGIDAPDRSGATGPIAVLASDGQTHRIIFCDAVNFISNAEIADEPRACEALSFKIGSRVLVPFLELSGLPSQVKD